MASTEVPSAEVTRPLPDSAAGAVGEVIGAFVLAAVVVAPGFVVVVVTAVVEDVVVVAAVVVVSATVVAGSTVEACAMPSCAKPAMPMAPARRRTLVARVVECVMLYSFRRLQVRTTKEWHDLKSQGLSAQAGAGAGRGV